MHSIVVFSREESTGKINSALNSYIIYSLNVINDWIKYDVTRKKICGQHVCVFLHNLIRSTTDPKFNLYHKEELNSISYSWKSAAKSTQ